MMVEDKSFTFRIPTDLLESAQAHAKAHDLSLAQLLRAVLREYMEKQNG